MTDEFNVVLFFPDGSYHYEDRWLSPKDAVRLAAECTRRPAAIAEFIARIIVTDADDCTVLVWEHGKGLTYPPEETMH